MNVVTIVPVPAADGKCSKTQGTQVLLADGSVLEGVTRIVLTAECNDIWRATIECSVRMQKFPDVMAQITATAFPEDVGEVDATTLDSTSREFYSGQDA